MTDNSESFVEDVQPLEEDVVEEIIHEPETNAADIAQTVVEKYFSMLPKTIRTNLANFISEYPYRDVRYHRFAVEFNNYLRKQYAQLFVEKTENSAFYGVKTSYVTSTQLWTACREWSDRMYDGDVTHLSLFDLIRVVQRVVGHDGFNVATDLYVNED